VTTYIMGLNDQKPMSFSYEINEIMFFLNKM